MTKKRPERPPEQKRTPLNADMVDAKVEELSDLTQRLSSVAQKMRARGVSAIESLGWRNLELAIKKLNGPIGSVERAYLNSSTRSVASKIAEKRAEYDDSNTQDKSDKD